MIHLWHSLRGYGLHHGVDPLVFAGLYAARLPLLLLALGAFVRRIRRRQPAALAGAVWLSLGVFPYTYVLAFGHGLPILFTVAVWVIAGLTLVLGVRKLRQLWVGAQ